MKQKGFTIIELIVVIAIIAVLATIVMINVTSYINKSKDASIQGNLASLLVNAAAYFDTNSSNTGAQFIADNTTGAGATSPITKAIEASNVGGDLFAVGDSTAGSQKWAACSKLIAASTSAYCVDYTGTKKVQASTTCDGNTSTGKSFSTTYTCN